MINKYKLTLFKGPIMNYQKHYDKLMNRAKNRYLNQYTEQHHIIPKCLGGNNSKTNLVQLTAEEHYVAHQLLVKLHPKNRSLIWAVHRMSAGSYKNPRNNKLYGWVRRKAAMANSGTGNPMSKLIESEVIEIYYSKSHTKELSKQYNISGTQITDIKRKASYKLVTKHITVFPGVHPSIKRIPLSDETIRQIYLDEGTPNHFKRKYRLGILAVKNIKNKKTYKKITNNLRKPGQIASYGLFPHDVFAIKNSKKSREQLAKIYNVHIHTIYNIQENRTRIFTDILY